jgi:hypothetical protein
MLGQQDKINWKIEEDGTITLTTDAVSGQNHVSADALLKALAEATGGPVKITKRQSLNVSLNAALDAHCHDGHTHSH